MSQIEVACKDLVFHFNKKHLEDPEIPMWVVKTRGQSYYVNHVTCELPWSTKETPDNSHTKGSIKVKHCLLTIDSENCAVITELTTEDQQRLSGGKQIYRFITYQGTKLKKFLDGRVHGAIKTFGGGCSTLWFVSEVYDQNILLLAQMAISDLRTLMPNEDYYRLYDLYEHADCDLDDHEDFYED